jgi:CBS domain-containing protein
MKATPISALMTTDLVQVSSDDTVDVVAEIFGEARLHHILVYNRNQEFCGIVSRTDFDKMSMGMSMLNVQKRAEYNDALYRSLRVLDVMTPQPVCLSPSDTLADAAAIFLENQFRALPITKEGKLVGILTPYDLIKYCLESDS